MEREERSMQWKEAERKESPTRGRAGQAVSRREARRIPVESSSGRPNRSAGIVDLLDRRDWGSIGSIGCDRMRRVIDRVNGTAYGAHRTQCAHRREGGRRALCRPACDRLGWPPDSNPPADPAGLTCLSTGRTRLASSARPDQLDRAERVHHPGMAAANWTPIPSAGSAARSSPGCGCSSARFRLSHGWPAVRRPACKKAACEVLGDHRLLSRSGQDQGVSC